MSEIIKTARLTSEVLKLMTLNLFIIYKNLNFEIKYKVTNMFELNRSSVVKTNFK